MSPVTYKQTEGEMIAYFTPCQVTSSYRPTVHKTFLQFGMVSLMLSNFPYTVLGSVRS